MTRTPTHNLLITKENERKNAKRTLVGRGEGVQVPTIQRYRIFGLI